jgi:hypothetical protein
MVLTAYSKLSPAIGLFVTVIPEKRQLLKNLTPASRRQDHMASPSATSAFVLCAIRVHRIFRPTFSDDRETPLMRAEDARKRACDLPVVTSECVRDILARRANQAARSKCVKASSTFRKDDKRMLTPARGFSSFSFPATLHRAAGREPACRHRR